VVSPSDMVMRDVPLDLCEPDGRFLYRITYDDVSDLAESIAWGQLEPAVGWEDPATGRCYVVAGIRRLMAARMARERYGRPAALRVLLVPADTPVSELWRIALEENLRRRNLTDVEVVRVIRRMLSGELAGVPGLDDLLSSYDARTRGYLVRLVTRATDEELEDFALAEKWARSSGVLLGKQHLHAYHMVRLLGQERYYRLAGAYFALVNDWRPDDDPVEHVRYMRSARLIAALTPIELRMHEIGVQPPEGGWMTPSLRLREERRGRDEPGGAPPRAGPAREVSEEALEEASPPRRVAPGASARAAEVGPVGSEPGTPAREDLAREAPGAEGTRAFRVLLGAGADEFDVTCPYCGRRYRIEIVRGGPARSP